MGSPSCTYTALLVPKRYPKSRSRSPRTWRSRAATMSATPEIVEINEKLQMTTLEEAKPFYRYSIEAFEELAITPWFSYRVTLPEDVPPLDKRPVTKWKDMVIRPLFRSDLEQFHKLRSNNELQRGSWLRGRADKTKEESREYLEQMQDFPEAHWYFGLFDADEKLVGEGGLAKLNGCSVSGWPELDLIVDPAHQRKGCGTALFHAVVSTWFALARERRRYQLHPWGVLGLEPGTPLPDCVAMYWDKENHAAEKFFAKVLGERDVHVTGTFEDFDKREGSETEGQVMGWRGTAIPNPLPFEEPKSDDDDDDDDDNDDDDED